jgi:hypothetical protein
MRPFFVRLPSRNPLVADFSDPAPATLGMYGGYRLQDNFAKNYKPVILMKY